MTKIITTPEVTADTNEAEQPQLEQIGLKQLGGETRYTQSADGSSWLKVRLEPHGTLVDLPEYIEVTTQALTEGRLYFLIQEGIYSGNTASLLEENAKDSLISTARGTGAQLTLKTIQQKPVKFSVIRHTEWGDKTLNPLLSTFLIYNNALIKTNTSANLVFIENNSPITSAATRINPAFLPKGRYHILAPVLAISSDAPFENMPPDDSSAADQSHAVWFPIALQTEVSGVPEDTEWQAAPHPRWFLCINDTQGIAFSNDQSVYHLYHYLISNRSDEAGKYIGTLVIK